MDRLATIDTKSQILFYSSCPSWTSFQAFKTRNMASGQPLSNSEIAEIAANVRIDPDCTTVSRIFQWAQSKRGEIERAFRMKGGWEAWLQVELALWLEEQADTASIVREQHVYSDSSLAVDLLVKTTSGTRSMFELKCESVNQDCRFNQDGEIVLVNGQPVSKGTHRGPGSTGPMIPAFAKRLEQELEPESKIAAANRPCQYTVLGISLTRDALDFAAAEKARDDRYFMPITARTIRGAEADPRDTFVLWYKSVVVREPFDLGGVIV